MPEPTGRAFIVRPFGQKSNTAGGAVIDFDAVDRELITPALTEVGLTGGTTGEFVQQGNIRADMFRQLLAADLVIADLSIHNANAFYELGIRHALRDQYSVLIKSGARGDKHVFDLNSDRYFSYDPDDPADAVDQLVDVIKATFANEGADSPVFHLLPGLTSFDANKVVVVPLKFQERVRIAECSKNSNTELQALFAEASGKAWEEQAVRLLGEAQFQLKQHEAARKSWERVREFHMLDVDANQRLATIYQKLKLRTKSELAAERALMSGELTDWNTAETHALIGSNHKTAWHSALKEVAKGTERQRWALRSPLLQKSYDAYHKGFERHRSHYYSGLNATATLAIQVALAKLHPSTWALDFADDQDAEFALARREKHLARLVVATELAIESSIKNYAQDPWARISKADLMLLSGDDPQRVAHQYLKCVDIPKFNAEALRRQLEIYRDLDLFVENVSAALEAFPVPKTASSPQVGVDVPPQREADVPERAEDEGGTDGHARA